MTLFVRASASRMCQADLRYDTARRRRRLDAATAAGRVIVLHGDDTPAATVYVGTAHISAHYHARRVEQKAGSTPLSIGCAISSSLPPLSPAWVFLRRA